MTLAFNPDWNSFISALIGGGLALLGTFITLKGTKKQREKEDSRELISLFYFLNSKAGLLMKLGNHPEGVPVMSIVTEDELVTARKMYAVASRAITLDDIGEIESFCNSLRSLESIRRDCVDGKGNKQSNLDIYQQALLGILQSVNSGVDRKGITDIGKRIEYYFSKELKREYIGNYKYQ